MSKNKLIAVVLAAVIVIAAAVCLFILSNKEGSTACPITVSEGEYVLAMLSDTQFYSRSKPESFNAMTQFLSDNKEALKLQYVFHTGDIVNSPYETGQWQAAAKAISLLGDIPYGVLPGNHDTGNAERKYTDYCSFFGEKHFTDRKWYGESHEDNRAHYDLMTMGGTDFVIVHLSDDPAKCCIDFANESFAKYPERIGILCTHKYLDEDGTLCDMGDYMQKKILAQNENVRLVLCGHNSITGYLTSELKNADGTTRTVQQIIANYQNSRNEGGGGYMLLLRINEQTKTLDAITYSPLTGGNQGHDDEISIDNFSLPLPW